MAFVFYFIARMPAMIPIIMEIETSSVLVNNSTAVY